MKKETIQKVINFVITVLTAVLSSFCVQSCKLYHNLYIFFFEHELHESNEYILFKHGKFVSFEKFVFS